jgi:PhzF family phenazine biosynthesis protein
MVTGVCVKSKGELHLFAGHVCIDRIKTPPKKLLQGETIMRIPIYQIDAFTAHVFSGNPAAVCLLEDWIDDRQLQGIAAENNLSETAFLVRSADGFELRWFTPAAEVALCGHATLASAYVIFNFLDWSQDNVRFQTRKSGQLTVKRVGQRLEMDFPARRPVDQPPPDGLNTALGVQPLETYASEEDILVVLENEGRVRSLQPDINALGALACRGTIVTAKGRDCDFVSRFFAPRVGVAEDPVTGSAHCVLVPYWADKLGKSRLHALQVSRRGGELFCEDRGERVGIAGNAVFFMEGTLTI